jgi:EC042_2821-lke REase
LEDDGSMSQDDVSALNSFDVAKITDQIAKYTQVQFSNFFVFSIVRDGRALPAIGIGPVRLPIVFTHQGNYEMDDGRQKTAFSKGTLYFRHGAKSEPADQHDISEAFYREIARTRKEWFENMRQVVEADPGSQIIIAPAGATISSVRLSDDPSALAVRVRNLSETHPYRQSEAIKKIRQLCKTVSKLNSHDIQCIVYAENLSNDTRPDLVHKPHEFASPQYSEDFVSFVSERIAANSDYLIDCRNKHKDSKYGSAYSVKVVA